MSKKLKMNLNIEMLPLIILLCTASMKWFIEGILDKALLEVVFLFISLGIAVLIKGFKVIKISLPWLTYIINIFFSLVISNSSLGLWGRGLITILLVAHVFVIDASVLSYKKIVKIITFFGVITGVIVIVHFLLGDKFNDLYFPLLNSTAKQMAELYTRYNYYFGLLYNPHEPAGLIAFAIGSLIIWNILSKSKKLMIYIGALFLIIPLLLTGKKAVLLCMILALSITFLILYKSRKQWGKILKFVGLISLFIFCFVLFVIRNPQIEIFNRFNQFFSQLTSGDFYDSGRINLYRIAFSEWKENPILGIGWRHYNALTTTKYGLTQSHEVNCDYLQWLCETGIVGFVLSIIPVVITLKRAIYVEKRLVINAKNINESWIIIFSVFIQIYTLIYAFIEIPFFDIVYFSIYIISCIVINSAYRRRNIIYE